MRPIRCHKVRATPYLRYHLPDLPVRYDTLVLDLGCGNLRNTCFAKRLGFKRVKSIDAAGDFGIKAVLGTDPIPAEDDSAGLILCNYLLCFLNERERSHLIKEIKRVSFPGAHIILEMYPAKQGKPYDLDKIVRHLGWTVLHRVKDRFIARRDR